jgi:hypothetical protein
VMNWRRFTVSGSRASNRKIAHLGSAGALRCGMSIRPIRVRLDQVGRSRG